MSYEIINYKDGFIEDQFKIGSAIYDKWRMGGQTRPEQLAKTYSGDTFDPETKFYAFQNGEMVGFLTAAEKQDEEEKTAFFEFPYVKPNHKKATDELIQTALQKLRDKGYKKLIARAGEYWGESKQLAEKYGFSYSSDIVRGGEIHLDEVNLSSLDEPKDILPFDYNRDINEVTEIFSKIMGIPLEQMRVGLDRYRDQKIRDTIINPWGQDLTLISSIVARVNEKLVARVTVMEIEAFGSKNAVLSSFYLDKNYEDLLSQILHQIIIDAKSQDYHRLIIHTGPWAPTTNDNHFKPFGFTFYTKLAYYLKKL